MALFKKENSKTVKDIEKEQKDLALVSNIQRMYREAYAAKEELHRLWDKCFKAYTGEYFNNNRPSYVAKELSNYIFATVETVKPIMLANNPKFIALPRKEEFYEKSELVQEALDYEWKRTNMFRELHRAITIGLITGTVPISLIWDSTADKGLGQIKPLILNPFNVFVDPMATNIEDAEYIIYAAYKNVGQLINFAPDKAEEIKGQVVSHFDEWLTYGKDTTNVDNTVLYIEAYFRDYSRELIDESEEGEKTTRLKYPNGRRVIIAGDVLLYDGENPYEDGKFPFEFWKCYEVPGRFWGMGEVEHIISPQESATNLINHVLDSARLMSNPVWILDKNSGIKKNSLTNRDGLVIRKNPGSEVRREQPPAMPAYVQNIISLLRDDIELISGVYDVTRGERPTGITAAAAIQALNEQAQGRIRLKIQTLEDTLSKLGAMWVSRMKQFWTTPRSIRVVGDDYKVQFREFNPNDFVDGDWDIIISAGSTMAVNKTARLQQIIQLSQTIAEDGLPVVDRQTILENSELPNVKEILERFNNIKMQQQQQQQNAMLDQLALQDVQNQLQSNIEMSNTPMQQEIPNQQIEQEQMINEVMQLIQNLSPDEIADLAEKNPEVAYVLEILSQIEHPEQGLA